MRAIDGTRTSNFIIGSGSCEALNHDGVSAVAIWQSATIAPRGTAVQHPEACRNFHSKDNTQTPLPATVFRRVASTGYIMPEISAKVEMGQ
jgi:hypothetical protein